MLAQKMGQSCLHKRPMTPVSENQRALALTQFPSAAVKLPSHWSRTELGTFILRLYLSCAGSCVHPSSPASSTVSTVALAEDDVVFGLCDAVGAVARSTGVLLVDAAFGGRRMFTHSSHKSRVLRSTSRVLGHGSKGSLAPAARSDFRMCWLGGCPSSPSSLLSASEPASDPFWWKPGCHRRSMSRVRFSWKFASKQIDVWGLRTKDNPLVPGIYNNNGQRQHTF